MESRDGRPRPSGIRRSRLQIRRASALCDTSVTRWRRVRETSLATGVVMRRCRPARRCGLDAGTPRAVGHRRRTARARRRRCVAGGRRPLVVRRRASSADRSADPARHRGPPRPYAVRRHPARLRSASPDSRPHLRNPERVALDGLAARVRQVGTAVFVKRAAMAHIDLVTLAAAAVNASAGATSMAAPRLQRVGDGRSAGAGNVSLPWTLGRMLLSQGVA